MITEVLERAVHAVDDVVGVKVAFGSLRGAHNVDGFISGGFQRLVGVLNQGIADGFNPLAEVSILKQEAVELVLIRVRGVIGKGIVTAVGVRLGRILRALLTGLCHYASCQMEIMHTPALFRAGDAVIERFPLVGNDFAADELRFPLPERVSDGNGVEVDWVREASDIHGVDSSFFRCGVVLMMEVYWCSRLLFYTANMNGLGFPEFFAAGKVNSGSGEPKVSKGRSESPLVASAEAKSPCYNQKIVGFFRQP